MKFLDRLHEEGLVFDGAMGTELIKHGLKNGESSAMWSETNPGRILGIHNEYRHAGARAITTNTFGASPLTLRRLGLEDRSYDLCQRSARIARVAAGPDGFVLGDIGPCGEFLEPLGELTQFELEESLEVQARGLLEGRIDAFLVETMSDPTEMALTISCLKQHGLPVIATYTFDLSGGGFRTMMGASPATAIRAAITAGADAVGANCGNSLSLEHYLHLAREILQVAGKTPVILQPNAGAPEMEGDAYRYQLPPGAMLPWARRAMAMGVMAVGGCCGTTPEHIRAIAASHTGDELR